MSWTQADATLLRRNVRAAFFGALEGPELDLAGLLATTIETTDPTEDYAWLGNVPAVREFIGDRVIKDLVTEKYSLSDKTWEATIGFDRHTIEDGKLGQVQTRIADLAARATQHRNRRMTQVMVAGNATNCYDGQYFYDSDHPSNAAGGANRTNLIAHAVADADGNISGTEGEEILQKVMQHFVTLNDDQGEPMGMSADGIVIVGHVNHWKGMAVALGSTEQATYNAESAVTGAFRGRGMRYVVNPYLTAEELMYCFKVTKAMKPFIFQSRLPIELEDNLDGDMWFKSNKAEFGTRARYEVGYGPWEYAAQLTLSDEA